MRPVAAEISNRPRHLLEFDSASPSIALFPLMALSNHSTAPVEHPVQVLQDAVHVPDHT